MTDPDRTSRIFQEALEFAPPERAAFVRKACAGDDDLRGDVESLLRHHQTDTLSGMLVPGSKDGPASRRHWIRSLIKTLAAWSTPFHGRRLQWLTWILTAALLAGGGYWTRDRVRRVLRAQIDEQLRVVLLADTTALETWISARIGEVQARAEDPAVRDIAERLVRAAGEDPARAAKLRSSPLQQEFASVVRRNLTDPKSPEDIGQVLIDRTGLRLAATPPFEGVIGNTSNERAAAALVPVLDGQAQFLPPSRTDAWAQHREADATPLLILAAPVRNSSGRIIAVLVFAKKVGAAYSQILSVARMGASGETYAFSAEGMLLSPSRFEGLLKQTGLIPNRPDVSSMLTAQIRDPGGDVARGYRPELAPEAWPLTTIARVAAGSRGKAATQQTGVVTEPYRDYRGVEVVGAWRWFEQFNFGVVTEVDAAEAFAVVNFVGRSFNILFALLSAFVALNLVISIVLARDHAGETRMGAYTLLQLIGEGGMSKVYLARHALLRRPAAVKVLHTPQRPSREAIVRFEREVQAASGLTHPNTIQIYDFGQTTDGGFYYAMEYLRGLSLAELVSLEGAITPARVTHILKQVCGSLREAHGQGILHRDIKPLNIMLCERGGEYDFVKVLDFGLVRRLDEQASLELSAPDHLIGTPLYMAPERFANPSAADPRSDIYSIGATAYFLLTGRPVFQALTGLELQNQVLHAEPERPSKWTPHPIPSGLEQLVLKCLSKAPADRPDSIAALLQALDALADVPPWTQQQAQECWERTLPGFLKAMHTTGGNSN